MRFIPIFSAFLLACEAASPPTPNFAARRDYYTSLNNYVDVADTNGDGIPDIITTGYNSANVLLGHGNGTFHQGPQTQTGLGGGIGIAADMAGNAKVSLVFAGNSAGFPQSPWGIGVCLGNGDGTFQKGVVYQAGTDIQIDWPVVGDFNGDGILDAATIGESGLWVFLGTGEGALAPGVLTPFSGPGNGEIFAGDFNGDGKLDVVVTTWEEITTHTSIAVFLGNGDGTFQSPKLITNPYHPGRLAVGDINNDGYDDIAMTLNGNPNQVALYFGGKSAFSGPDYVNLQVPRQLLSPT